MKTTSRKFGWIRDLPDHRDLERPLKWSLKVIPRSVDLSGKCPPVYDQKNLGSCTANAGGGLAQYTRMESKQQAFMPSRLALYWFTRSLMGSTGQDSGASIRDTFKAMNQFGVCREVTWPYVVKDFKKKPSKAAQDESAAHRVVKYERVEQSESAICDAIAAGDPVVFGFSVFNDFKPNPKTFIVPLPGKKDRVQGGHAIIIVGYDRDRQLFKIRNSWGIGFGNKGYAYMPFDYVLNQKLASDFWTLQSVS